MAIIMKMNTKLILVIVLVYISARRVNAPGKLAFWMNLISIAFSSPVWIFCFLAFWRNHNSHAVIRRSQRREEYFFSSIPKGVAKGVDLTWSSTFPSVALSPVKLQVSWEVLGPFFTFNRLQYLFSNYWDIPSWPCFVTVLKPFWSMPPKVTFGQILCWLTPLVAKSARFQRWWDNGNLCPLF